MITVVRDEVGNIDHTDNLRVPWEEPTWLSRKAGASRGSLDAQARGARKLIEEELMSPIAKYQLETDDQS